MTSLRVGGAAVVVFLVACGSSSYDRPYGAYGTPGDGGQGGYAAPPADVGDGPTSPDPPPPAPRPSPERPGSSSTPALAQNDQEARGCNTAQDCVITCKVDGDCCGTYCGCSNALSRGFLPRLEAHQAQVCQPGQFSCMAVGCALRGPFFPVCERGLCQARTMDDFKP